MPPKRVLQYQCERCPATWYLSEAEAAKEKPYSIEVKADFGDGSAPIQMTYTCLCASCKQTVATLLRQASRTLQKMSAVRVAKKKSDDAGKPADKGSPSSADTVPTKSSATADSLPPKSLVAVHPAPPVVTLPAPAHSGAAASSGKVSQAAGNHPRQ